MKDQDRRLVPPTAMLTSFAAAARHGSFSRAAAELSLTQGAISRQIASLERWLGRSLFERRGRRVSLNDDGRAYAEAIAPALADIRRSTRRAMEDDGRQALEIATLPSFGMRWLAPRLPRLTSSHPSIVVNLTARSDEFDLDAEGFDAAIHYGLPEWPAAEHHLLFRERLVPVVAAGTAPLIRDAQDLRRVPLLTLRSRPRAWAVWFMAQGLGETMPPISATHNQFLLLAQAVLSGGGAALIPRFLIEPELAAGTLVAPFAATALGEQAYYLVTGRRRAGHQAIAAFKSFLLDEAADARREDEAS